MLAQDVLNPLPATSSEALTVFAEAERKRGG